MGPVSPQPPPPPPSPLTAPATQPSLWRELSDGTATRLVRLLATLALAAALGGTVPILAYFLAAVDPELNRYQGSGPHPRDELVAFLVAVASGAFLAAAAWIWSRGERRRTLRTPVVVTIGAAAVTIAGAIFIDSSLPGDREFVIGGMVALSASVVLLAWLRALRSGPRGRALHNSADGLPDVRCPACHYRMVGLTESRCPECGAAYTLDELLARQQFAPQPAAQPDPPNKPALRSA